MVQVGICQMEGKDIWVANAAQEDGNGFRSIHLIVPLNSREEAQSYD